MILNESMLVRLLGFFLSDSHSYDAKKCERVGLEQVSWTSSISK